MTKNSDRKFPGSVFETDSSGMDALWAGRKKNQDRRTACPDL